MSKIIKSLISPKKGIVLSVKIRARGKGQGKIEVDENNKVITRKNKVVDWHAMFLSKVKIFPRLYKVENTWGEYWGDNGYCYFDINALQSEVQAAYSITFKK